MQFRVQVSDILAFGYDSAGEPILLSYFLKKEAGKGLQYSTIYQCRIRGRVGAFLRLRYNCFANSASSLFMNENDDAIDVK